MEKMDNALFEAFMAKDTRLDGRFFVGISSTKIYCRPVCWARQPKAENCTFFSSAAAAEKAGYRPCLLCRPELAPGNSGVDASSALAYKAARLMEEYCGYGHNLDKLAEKLGCTTKHLQCVFMEAYQVTPEQYLQTCRLLLAKNLLTDTKLPASDVAMASGIGSVEQLNDLFDKQYNLSPTALRKNLVDKEQISEITVRLGYHPPYRWEEIINFLSMRAIPGVENVVNGKYMRTVRLKDKNGDVYCGWISVGNNPKKNTLSVTLSYTLIPVLSQILARVKRLFDLYCEPNTVYEVLKGMNEIRPGLCIFGIRVPGCFDSFEMVVRAVLGQQITVKAASTLAGRIADTYGIPIDTGFEGLTHTFPEPGQIADLGDNIEEHLGILGVIASRSRCILALAKALDNGEIEFVGYMDPELEMKKLMEIKGIGSWTAKYIAMRTMEWTDAFLETDIGIKHALPNYTPGERLALSEKWRPWRSYAMMNLWNSLG